MSLARPSPLPLAIAVAASLALLASCKSTPFAEDRGASGARASAPMDAGVGARSAPEAAAAAPAPIPVAPGAPTPFGEKALAPSGLSSGPTPPSRGHAAAPASAAWPTSFPALVERLRADAAAGRDPALAGHADLLEAVGRLGADAGEETIVRRVPELEASEQARFGHGTGWATVVCYVVSDARGPQDAAALRAAYLDFDRVAEFTGKTGTRVVERRPDVVLGLTDGVRTALGLRFGARWAFEAHPLDRGPARLISSRQRDDPTTWKMLSTRGVLVAFPEAGGVRIVECAASVLDFEVPAPIRSLAINTAISEMKARANGVRSHWREYLGR